MSSVSLKITIDDGSLIDIRNVEIHGTDPNQISYKLSNGSSVTVEIQQHISLEAAHRVLFPRGDHAELLERP